MMGTGVGLLLNQANSASALTDQRLSLPIVAGAPCANAAPVAVDANNADQCSSPHGVRSPIALTANTGTRATA